MVWSCIFDSNRIFEKSRFHDKLPWVKKTSSPIGRHLYSNSVSLGDLINLSLDFDLNPDQIDLIDPNLKPDFYLLQWNQLNRIRI